MTRATDIVSEAGTSPVFMCDFSPPRDPSANWLDDSISLNADLICVPHLAPHPSRPDAITAAHAIRSNTGTEVVFNLATRDSNKSEVRDRLTRARRLGLENIVVLQGDADRGVTHVDQADRFTPTDLIRELKSTHHVFCVGAVADLAKGVESEANLCLRKIEAGADFLLLQPTFDIEGAERFLTQFGKTVPIFFGVQVLAKGGIVFTPIPDPLRLAIDNGCSGVETAKKMICRLLQLGINCYYLIAPIYPGGTRDYHAALQVMT